MAFADVHTHLDHPMFADDFDTVIARAKKAGVAAIISNGTSPKSNRAVLDLARRYDIVKPALGIHPEDAHAAMPGCGKKELAGMPFSPEPFDVDEELAFIRKNKNKIIAVGECGLDLHWVKGHLDEQIGIFRKHIELARKIKKPIIVHTRDAEKESLDLLEEMGAKRVLLHAFGGSKRLMLRAASLGFSLSIPPSIKRSSHFQMIAREVNINQLLTETDAPFLGPVREKRNEPANVALVVDEIAKMKGFTTEDTEQSIWLNYQRLFL